MAMQWNKDMTSFYYASPPPPPPDVIPPPQAPYDGYYPSSPPPSYADPPSSLPLSPPLPASAPPAFEPPSAPVDAYSPPPPPPVPPLTPPPAVIPPTSSSYYQSPPPPPPSHMLPPALPCPPPISSSPLPSVSNSNPTVSSPMLPRKPPSLPSATPLRPKTPNFHNPARDTNSVQRNNGSPRNGMATAGTVATAAAVAGLVMLTFIGAAVWLVKKRRKPIELIGHGGNAVMPSPVSSHLSESSHARSPSYPLVRHGSEGSYGLAYSPSEPGLGHTRLWFTLEELSIITNNFSAQNLLGEGGSGCVYKGCLSDGREVAIKQLKVGGAQGDRQFRAEVETISRAHHRHLVSLVGYCVSENERLLVYDYVPNGTLYYHLHGKSRPVMEWTTRVKVAAGAAHGIAYLHEDCNPRIIHRDIKSSNILLDYNFEAKVSDFGLARAAMDGNTHVSTHVMGTFGYLAPEYAKSGMLTAKSDVYSFGVVLLELITGRKPVDKSQPLGDESLAEWARPLLIQAIENEDFGCLPDPRLDGNFDRGEMFHLIELAAACTRHSSTMRPRMAQVVRALDGLADLDINNGVRPGQSEIFNSSPRSEEIRMFQMMGFED